jgi:hypothetical protein
MLLYAYMVPSMARLAIYVSEELKARMDALGDRVKWSRIAQLAFEREVAAATIPADPNLTQVIERLRATKVEDPHADLTRARERGRDWAMREANYQQLKEISGLVLTGTGYARQFAQAVKAHDKNDWPFFWGSPNAPLPPDDYVEAFLEGAKVVWREVADKI